MLTTYGISTLGKLTSQRIPKLGGTITVKRISISTDNQNSWRTGRNSKGQSRKQNATSLTKKSMRLLTRSVVYRSS